MRKKFRTSGKYISVVKRINTFRTVTNCQEIQLIIEKYTPKSIRAIARQINIMVSKSDALRANQSDTYYLLWLHLYPGELSNPVDVHIELGGGSIHGRMGRIIFGQRLRAERMTGGNASPPLKIPLICTHVLYLNPVDSYALAIVVKQTSIPLDNVNETPKEASFRVSLTLSRDSHIQHRFKPCNHLDALSKTQWKQMPVLIVRVCKRKFTQFCKNVVLSRK